MPETARISARTDNGIFFYYRRVPKRLAHLDGRRAIRLSLGTANEAEAVLKARRIDEEQEALWATLLLDSRGAPAAWERYEIAVTLAKTFGFTYRSVAELAKGSIEEIVERVLAAKQHKELPQVVEAIVGTAGDPEPRLSDLWTIYQRHREPELVGLSPRQLVKHENGRQRAMANVVRVLGDMALKDIVRMDVLRYRDTFAARVKTDEIGVETANREFSDLKGMISVVDDALFTTYSTVWRSINIRRRGAAKQKKRTRPPYPLDFVQDRLLAPGALDGLNNEARTVLYAMVETGLRLSEACNLRAQDIRIDAEIPHLAIEQRGDREQKTVYSIRTIPLVGVSLWALRQSPGGFPRYQDKGDTLSAVINKFLRENDLRPTPKHSVYSLRHTFQDRLLAAGAPDRLQTDLMGHEFERESYGAGSSMQQKLELLEKIKFTWEPAASVQGARAPRRPA